MIVFKFIWYCLTCMFDVFLAAAGFVPNDFTWKQGLTGVITLIIIIVLVLSILLLTGVVKIKNKKGK